MAENMNLITGYQGTPHVTSADDGILNAALLGEGAYLLNVGNKLSAEIVSNNQIRIYDGAFSAQGRIARVDTSTYVDLTIDNGSQGMKRNDLICVRYEKDADTLKETANLVVIKGTETAGTPTDPSYTSGDIFNGDLVAEFPLYRISIDGITVGTPALLASKASALDYLDNAKLKIVRLAPNATLAFSATAATAILWNTTASSLIVGFRNNVNPRILEGNNASQIVTTASGTNYTIKNNTSTYLRGFIVLDSAEV